MNRWECDATGVYMDRLETGPLHIHNIIMTYIIIRGALHCDDGAPEPLLPLLEHQRLQCMSRKACLSVPFCVCARVCESVNLCLFRCLCLCAYVSVRMHVSKLMLIRACHRPAAGLQPACGRPAASLRPASGRGVRIS